MGFPSAEFYGSSRRKGRRYVVSVCMETVKCERANRIDRKVNDRGYIPSKINADSFENNFHKLFATKLGKLARSRITPIA